MTEELVILGSDGLVSKHECLVSGTRSTAVLANFHVLLGKRCCIRAFGENENKLEHVQIVLANCQLSLVFRVLGVVKHCFLRNFSLTGQDLLLLCRNASNG